MLTKESCILFLGKNVCITNNFGIDRFGILKEVNEHFIIVIFHDSPQVYDLANLVSIREAY
jgi:hypothetical protein